MNELDAIKGLLGVLGALVWWLWQRNEKRWDKQFDCNHTQSARMGALELKIAGELPSTAEFEKFSDQVFARLDKIDDKVGKLNDIVIKLEAQAQKGVHEQG